jgi:hypothetical protein
MVGFRSRATSWGLSKITLSRSSLALLAYVAVVTASFVLHWALVPTVPHYLTHRRANEVMDVPNMEPYMLLFLLSGLPVAFALFFTVRMQSTIGARLLIALGCLTGLCTLTLYGSRWSLLCDYSMTDMGRLCEYGHRMVTLFDNDPDIGPGSVWVINGTLIALMRREATNSLLLNDHDIDFCYDGSKFDAILAALDRNGYYYRYLQIGSHHMIRMWPGFAALHTGHSGVLTMDMEACQKKKVIMVEGCNGHRWPAPEDYDLVISEPFGTDWRIPKASNHWFVCSLFGGLGQWT